MHRGEGAGGHLQSPVSGDHHGGVEPHLELPDRPHHDGDAPDGGVAAPLHQLRRQDVAQVGQAVGAEPHLRIHKLLLSFS